MFEAKIAKASIWKKIIDAIKELLNEANFDCSENAIALQAMDSSHVALVSLKLEAQGFEEYRCDRTTNLGLTLKDFAKVVKAGDADHFMTLRYADDSDNYSVIFQDPNTDERYVYELKLIDLDAEHLGIPDQDYSCVVEMPSAKFQKICQNMAMFGDSMTITATKNGVQFSSKGDMGTATGEIYQSANADEAGERVVVDLREPVNITFAVKYLNTFTKATPLSPSVKLSLSNEVPIVVQYDIEEMGYVRYYLAPKIEEDENN